MNIVNLGEASFRKSNVAQALDSYKTVKETQIGQQNADTNQREQESLAAYRPQEIEAKKNALAVELAKMNKEDAQKNFDNGYKLLTDASNKADTFADETSKAMWEQSEGYKQLTKVVKKYLGPEFVTEDGKLNYIGKQTRVEDQLKRIEGQLGGRLQAVGYDGLTTQEKDLYDFFKNVGTEQAAAVINQIGQDTRYRDAQDAGDTKRMAQIAQEYRDQIFKQTRKGNTATEALDPNDPLGIRGKHA